MVRVKRRYLTLLVRPEDRRVTRIEASEKDVADVIKEAVRAMHGDFGLASVRSLQVKKFSVETGVAILSVQRGQHELIASAVPFVKRFKDLPCCLQLLHLSGTIRCAVKFLIRMYQHQSQQFLKQLQSLRQQETQ